MGKYSHGCIEQTHYVMYLITECGCDTCLHYAGKCGSFDIMKYLITECKCDPKVADNDGSILNKNMLSSLDPMCKNNNGYLSSMQEGVVVSI